MDFNNFFTGTAAFAPGGITVVGLLIFILIAGSRGMWYYGSTYRAKAKEAEDWKLIAISSTDTNKKLADQNEALVEINETLSKALSVRRR